MTLNPIKYIIAIVLLMIMGGTNAYCTEVSFSPFGGYGRLNFIGQTEVPSYNGSNYGLTLEFKQKGTNFSFSLYGEYSKGSFENTNNNALQKENLDTQNITGGFKLYYHDVYLKLGFGKNKINDKSEGTISKEINLNNDVYQVGVGTLISISQSIQLFFEADANYSNFEPEFNGLTQETRLLSYMGNLGIKFILPSDFIPDF